MYGFCALVSLFPPASGYEPGTEPGTELGPLTLSVRDAVGWNGAPHVDDATAVGYLVLRL